MLLRYAYNSPGAAVLAVFLAFVLVISPVVAVEALLLSGLLCLIGVASYWPSNIFVYAISTAGVAGCVNGCIMWWEKRQQRARSRQRQRGQRKPKGEKPSTVGTIPEDDSAGLVALALGAVTAAIVGALP